MFNFTFLLENPVFLLKNEKDFVVQKICIPANFMHAA